MTTPALQHLPIARAARVLVVLTTLAAIAFAAAPVAAAASCGSRVIDDWYDDGRVDGTYALHCYDDAIETLPRDVREYSSAKDDIERALQARMRNEPAPPATTDPSPDGEDPGTPDPADPDDPNGSDEPETLPPVGESASSVPVPLLVLTGLALLLVAGGSAGYLVRRIQSRRLPPPGL